MSRSSRLALAGLGLALLAGALWVLKDRADRRHLAVKTAWFAYLRGPLSDLLEGESRGRALLQASLRTPLHAGQRAQLAAAAGLVGRSASALEAQRDAWAGKPLFSDLGSALEQHRSLGTLAAAWPGLPGDRPATAASIAETQDGLHGLAEILRRQREALLHAQAWTQDDQLEANALIYSLTDSER